MPVDLKSRSLVSMADLSWEEMERIFDTTRRLKQEQKARVPHPLLAGRTLAMIFEKPSTRTRVSFEVGMYQLGGMALYLSSNDLQIGRGESIADTARVLSRYVDAIMARTFAHKTVEDLARYAEVPVINGLSDEEHPCQILGDLFTVIEKRGGLKGLRIAYVGDGNNVAQSLILGAAKAGMHVLTSHPAGYLPAPAVVAAAREIAKTTGGSVTVGAALDEAVKGADVIYTDVWTSMGQEKEREARLKAFAGFQVNEALLKKAGGDVIVLHCLPAHRGEEITDGVMDGPQSAVFDEAENRLHVQKAILALMVR